jgi:hypothetical protein
MNVRVWAVITASAFWFGGCATAPPRPPGPLLPPPTMAPAPVPLERWAQVHPEAARELGDWARNHPEAAQRFFEWDGRHPEKAHEFVTWTVTQPSGGLDAFVATHPGWPFFKDVVERHRPAGEAFIVWCRRHPAAAEALMNHPRGLEWAGHHLYKM